MDLKHIQSISALFAYAFGTCPKIVVRNKNDLLFSANFVDYHDGSIWAKYTDSDGDTQFITISQSPNYECFNSLKTAFLKAYRLPFMHRWPNWTDAEKFAKIIDFVNSYEGELVEINTQLTNIALIDSNQTLDVILLEPDDEFTIIGMQ